MFTRGRIALSVLTVSALALVGCSDSSVDADDTSSSGDDAASVSFTDGFVKAKPAEKEMTGIFGTFTNTGDEDITLVGFTSGLDVPRHELHEVVDGVMQMKEGGFVLPAGEAHEFSPGGDHMMLMDYHEPIEAGDTLDIVLEFGDGSTREVTDVPVRTVASGEENYGDDGSLQSGHMDH